MAEPTPAPLPTVETPTDAPLWAREPAKLVGWIVTTVIVVAGAIVELGNDVVELLPASIRDEVRIGVGVAVTVGLIAGRVQTWMTRNGLGPTGNGKDGVWSPATVAAELEATATEVAAAKAVAPELHAR